MCLPTASLRAYACELETRARRLVSLCEQLTRTQLIGSSSLRGSLVFQHPPGPHLPIPALILTPNIDTMRTKQTARKRTGPPSPVFPRKKTESPKISTREPEVKQVRKKKEKPIASTEVLNCSHCNFASTSSAAIRSHTRLEHKLILKKVKPSQSEVDSNVACRL